MRKPDFFLVGAPKCGTTAMHDYLAAHPEVFMAKKERHYFGTDLRPTGYQGPHTDPGWYAAFFDGVTDERRVGEASVWYLYSKTAAEEIHAFNPEADVLIMLRNPVEMMHSLYNMFVWVKDLTPGGVIDAGTKQALSFEEALATQETRKAAFFARDARDAHREIELRLFHTDAARYAEQVARYLTVFGRDKVRVVLYDDFKADTPRVYRETLGWLGVDPSFAPSFAVVNPNRRIRHPKLHWLLRTHDSMGALRSVGRALVPTPVRKRVHRALMQFNVKHQPRAPMTPETRARLTALFRPDVERLGALLGRDLVALWL